MLVVEFLSNYILAGLCRQVQPNLPEACRINVVGSCLFEVKGPELLSTANQILCLQFRDPVLGLTLNLKSKSILNNQIL